MRRLGRNGEGVETTPCLDLMQEKRVKMQPKKKDQSMEREPKAKTKASRKTLGESQKKISGLFGLGQLPEIVLCMGGLYHDGIVTTSSLGRLVA